MDEFTWCEDNYELLQLNRLIKVRKRNIPIRAIKLVGDAEEVEYVGIQEVKTFSESLICYVKEETTRDDIIAAWNHHQILFFGESKYTSDTAFKTLITKELAGADVLTVDVRGMNAGILIDRFIKDLQLEGAEMIKDLVADKQVFIEKLKKDYAGTLMNVLLANVSHSRDGVFSPNDMIGITPLKQTDDFDPNDIGEKNVDEIHSAEKAPAANPAEEEVGSNQAPASSPSEDVAQVESDQQVDSGENDCDNIPIPSQKSSDNDNANCKSELTEEEKKRNEALLSALEDHYYKVSAMIKGSKDNRFANLAQRIDSAVKNKSFNTQWCPIYLDVSDDISTELYAALYELDKETLDFNNQIVRQKMHLECLFCGNEWEEDVTFRPSGIFFAECPKCAGTRPIEKE